MQQMFISKTKSFTRKVMELFLLSLFYPKCKNSIFMHKTISYVNFVIDGSVLHRLVLMNDKYILEPLSRLVGIF